MNAVIRPAQLSDIPTILRLAGKKRSEYETYQPVFWRTAPDAQEKQHRYFEQLITRENVIFLIYEAEECLEGFIIAALIASPQFTIQGEQHVRSTTFMYLAHYGRQQDRHCS